MTSNPDIWRAASDVLSRFGTEAPHVLSRQAERLRLAGDLDGRAVALMILSAVEELQRKELVEGERLH